MTANPSIANSKAFAVASKKMLADKKIHLYDYERQSAELYALHGDTTGWTTQMLDDDTRALREQALRDRVDELEDRVDELEQER